MSEETTTGQIERLERKEASNGGAYTVVTVEGKDFYDWECLCEQAEAACGEIVKIEHDGGRFPRVKGLARTVEDRDDDGSCDVEDWLPPRSTRTTRICAVKCAALLLQGGDLSYKERVGEVPVLAKKIEDWILEV